MIAVLPAPIVQAQGTTDTNLYVLVDQGDEIAHPELHNVQAGDDAPTAEVVVRNSNHTVWFAVRTVDQSKWVLLPPCQPKVHISVTDPLDYDCGDATASLGRIPLTADRRVIVSIDGTGGDQEAAEHLLLAYGAEIFWRAAMSEPLPPTAGRRIEDAAYGLADAEIANFGGDIGAAGPVYDLVNIGRAARAGDPAGAVDAAFELAQDKAVTDWFIARGLVDTPKMNAWVAHTKQLGRALYGIELTTLLADLPLRFSVEALTPGGATFGALEFHVPDYVARAAAARTAGAPIPERLPRPADTLPTNPGTGVNPSDPLVRASQTEIDRLSSSLPLYAKANNGGPPVGVTITSDVPWVLSISIEVPFEEDSPAARDLFRRAADWALRWIEAHGGTTTNLYVSWGFRAYQDQRAQEWLRIDTLSRGVDPANVTGQCALDDPRTAASSDCVPPTSPPSNVQMPVVFPGRAGGSLTMLGYGCSRDGFPSNFRTATTESDATYSDALGTCVRILANDMGGSYPIDTYFTSPTGQMILGSANGAPPHALLVPRDGAVERAFGFVVFFPRGANPGQWKMNVYAKAGESIDAEFDIR
jgi:hypothetical protein